MEISQTCSWEYTGGNWDYWETGCGETFCFTDGKPLENGFDFCPYCGERIEIKAGE